jgi:putative zinc finger protein
MSMQVAEAIRVTGHHLDPRDVVAYVDRASTPSERARIESHLVTCPECRAEVSEAAHIIATLPPARGVRRGVLITAAGIAAVLLVFLLPRTDRQIGQLQHREAAVTTTVAPVILAPVGAVESADVFTWSSVPHADRYELRVFDSDASVVWQTETTDTVVSIPRTVSLRPEVSYYSKVQAHTGIERSTSTDLVEFSIRAQQRP